MDLLVAYKDDPAGFNMATALSREMERDGRVFRGERFDLLIIETPAISADWLEAEFQYDGYVFLSKHYAESGVLALTCHSTGNFNSEAKFGGNPREVAVPYPSLQKRYLREIQERSDNYPGFEITIEATHHGPTALSKPTLFVEVGTGIKQWNDADLCGDVARALRDSLYTEANYPYAIGFGGTHYPKKFTSMILYGEYALGTVVPRHAVEYLDESLLQHILERNSGAHAALVDEKGLGRGKRRILGMLEGTDLEVIAV